MATSTKELQKFYDIPNFVGLYQINKLGDIRSLNHSTLCKDGTTRNYKGKLLTHSIDKMKYHHVRLCKQNEYTLFKVHSLIAQVFLGHVPCGHEIVIDHIDNDKDNNKLSNIQLISHRENCSKDKTSTSGLTGVSWNKTGKKWVSMITILGKKVHLGLFNCKYKASEAYQNKVKQL